MLIDYCTAQPVLQIPVRLGIALLTALRVGMCSGWLVRAYLNMWRLIVFRSSTSILCSCIASWVRDTMPSAHAFGSPSTVCRLKAPVSSLGYHCAITCTSRHDGISHCCTAGATFCQSTRGCNIDTQQPLQRWNRQMRDQQTSLGDTEQCAMADEVADAFRAAPASSLASAGGKCAAPCMILKSMKSKRGIDKTCAVIERQSADTGSLQGGRLPCGPMLPLETASTAVVAFSLFMAVPIALVVPVASPGTGGL